MTRLGKLVKLCERALRPARVARALSGILNHEYGHDSSVRRGESIGRNGKPVPWFTYPAVEYLDQFDFSQKSVFEFGAGNSTLFWCERAARVTSVEHNPEWHQRVQACLPTNGRLMLVPAASEYPLAIEKAGGPFDVIVIDGVERRSCCDFAVRHLARGGLIILDNADWHHLCAGKLRSAGLLEVDMSGFGPINDYTWTTSLFFHREFAFESRHERQPCQSVGGLLYLEHP